MKTQPPYLPKHIDDAALDALALTSGIEIPETSRVVVSEHFSTAASMAEILYAVPLDENHFEMAPVFCPQLPERET